MNVLPRSILHVSERTRAFTVSTLVCAMFALPGTASAKAPPKKPASAPAPAPAPPPATNDAAQELKLKGDAAFDARDFDAAAKAYEEGYAASKDPALLYNQGRTYQAMGRFPDALDRIERFSTEAPPTLKARVPKLDELVAQLRAKVATLEIHSNADSGRLVVDRQVIGEVAKSGTFRVNAGKVRVEITSDAYLPWAKEIDLGGGRTTVLDVKLVSKADGGVLVVKSNTTGADVAVDGQPSGQVPAELVLLAGAHKVTLSREGFVPVTSSSVVEPGKTKELYLPLEKNASIVEKWWFWTAAGVVVVAGGVLVFALVSEKDPPEGTLPPGRAAAPLLTF